MKISMKALIVIHPDYASFIRLIGDQRPTAAVAAGMVLSSFGIRMVTHVTIAGFSGGLSPSGTTNKRSHNGHVTAADQVF